MRVSITLCLLLFISGIAFPQQQGRRRSLEDEAWAGAKKEAIKQLLDLQKRMAKAGMRGEIADCDSIIKKLQDPTKMLTEKGVAGKFPGAEKYEQILVDWSETGGALSNLFKDAAGKIASEKEKKWAGDFSGWFATFPLVADGIRHLNKRRKACKLNPMTCDWSGSYGGFMHGLYMETNRDHPSTQGLGAHNEDPKLPGYTPEGAGAAKGIGGGGTPRFVMDSWLGSMYHRNPVFNPSVGRIAFGGKPGGWWWCKSAGGFAGRSNVKILHWPGADDTEISTSFGGELPNPLPKGVTRSGTMVIIQYMSSQPKKPVYELVDPDGNKPEILMLSRFSPVVFVAKDSLKSGTKYTVKIADRRGWKYEFSFTTR